MAAVIATKEEVKPVTTTEGQDKTKEKEKAVARMKEWRCHITAKERRRDNLNFCCGWAMPGTTRKQREEYNNLTDEIDDLWQKIAQEREDWYKKYQEGIWECGVPDTEGEKKQPEKKEAHEYAKDYNFLCFVLVMAIAIGVVFLVLINCDLRNIDRELQSMRSAFNVFQRQWNSTVMTCHS